MKEYFTSIQSSTSFLLFSVNVVLNYWRIH